MSVGNCQIKKIIRTGDVWKIVKTSGTEEREVADKHVGGRGVTK